jgi:hypothetical protein
MNLFEGVLLTGAVASGVVIVERLRGRNADDVRREVTELGESVAGQVGRAAGAAGRAGGKMLSWTGDRSEDVGEATTRIVSDVGRKVAGGTGAVLGAYAGAVDRILPGRAGGSGESDVTPPTVTSAA